MKVAALLSVLLFGISTWASFSHGLIYKKGETVPLVTVAESIEPGSIIIISEMHNFTPHHNHQMDFLLSLRWQNPRSKIHVGMEFFEYTKQHIVDGYRKKPYEEELFLNEMGWGNNDYNDYRPLVDFPSVIRNEWVLALNSPRFLTSKVAEGGLESLSDMEKALLPPNFQMGREIYYDRFKFVMGHGHPMPEPTLKKYFTAQSIWDDTMAWRATEFMKSRGNDFLVIIVGDFHNAYGGGLPHRIKARAHSKVVTVSQVNLFDQSSEEKFETVVKHPRWGSRADYVWVSDQEM